MFSVNELVKLYGLLGIINSKIKEIIDGNSSEITN